MKVWTLPSDDDEEDESLSERDRSCSNDDDNDDVDDRRGFVDDGFDDDPLLLSSASCSSTTVARQRRRRSLRNVVSVLVLSTMTMSAALVAMSVSRSSSPPDRRSHRHADDRDTVTDHDHHRRRFLTFDWCDWWVVRLAAEITYGLYPDEFPPPTAAPDPTGPPTVIYWDSVGTDVVGLFENEGLGSNGLELDGTGETMVAAGAAGSVRYYRLRVEYGHRRWSLVQTVSEGDVSRNAYSGNANATITTTTRTMGRTDVSLSEGLLVVGESGSDRVTLFSLNPDDDQWSLVETIEGQPGDGFGYAVDATLTGGRFVVGAPDANYVEVYDYNFDFRDGSSTLTVKLDVSGASYERFGGTVAVSGDGRFAAVGAYRSDLDKGCVSVYDLRNGNDPVRLQELVGNVIGAGITGDDDDVVIYHESTNDGRTFGRALAFNYDASVLVVGTHDDDYLQPLFYREGAGYVKLSHQVTGDAGTRFGAAISLDTAGGRMIVGAPGLPAAHAYGLRPTGSVGSLGSWLTLDFVENDDDDDLASTVAVAGDGSRVAVSGDPQGRGRIRVYGVLSFEGSPYEIDETTVQPSSPPSFLESPMPSVVGSPRPTGPAKPTRRPTKSPLVEPSLAPVVLTESPTRDPASFDWSDIDLLQILFYILLVIAGGTVTGITGTAVIVLITLLLAAVILMCGAPFILLFQTVSIVPTDWIAG